MASPRPTGAQLASIIAGAAGGAAVALVIGPGGALGGAIIGAGAALGAIPYSRAVQEHKRRER